MVVFHLEKKSKENNCWYFIIVNDVLIFLATYKYETLISLILHFFVTTLVLWSQHLLENTIIETTSLRLLTRQQLKYCYTLQFMHGKRVYTRLHGFGGLNDRDGRDKIYQLYRSKEKDFYRSSEESKGNINDHKWEQ